MTYEIKIDVFEGPFDLLLNLILKHEVDIYDVPIATITEEYLSYIERLQAVDLESASGFLLVASTLLELKSATLLPKRIEEESGDDDELSPEDVKENLIARLIKYKKFKNASLSLAARYELESRYYKREAGLEERFLRLIPDLMEGVTAEDLAGAIAKILAKKNAFAIDTTHIIAQPISLDEITQAIRKKFALKREWTFHELTSGCESRPEIVAYFLAILDLFKEDIIEVTQAINFGEIGLILRSDKSPESIEAAYGR
ncbi:MAG: segregation/condensation protein A [Actinomycetota bacterium]|nr:segregation/condensation protein A [Actinomycetota bacterium]